MKTKLFLHCNFLIIIFRKLQKDYKKHKVYAFIISLLNKTIHSHMTNATHPLRLGLSVR